MESKKSVAVVGAGPSGIFTSYALSTITDLVDFQVFDKQEQPGGQWFFNPNKVDKYGMTVHSSVYQDLWINGPKQALELPVYHFPEDLPSFFTRHDMTKYVIGFMDHFKLREKIQCSTLVQNVVFDNEKQKFSLTKKNMETGEIQTKQYDYVIISTGHFSSPHDPKFPSQQTFTGEVFHSHFFRDSRLYKDKRVLVVGGSYSSEDIALQCYKFGAKKVTIANRSKKFPFKWPAGIEQKPFIQIKNISESKIQFTDDSSDDFDVLIKCTGYLHDFPFIDQSIRLKTANILNPPLYQQIVHPENDRMFYVGMQDQYYTFSMFYLQGLYIRAVISGKVKVPSQQERVKWINEDGVEASKLKTAQDEILYQTRYIDGLASVIGQKSLDAADVFIAWEHHKDENIMTYRDRQFKSIFTSHLAPKGPAWATSGEGAVSHCLD